MSVERKIDWAAPVHQDRSGEVRGALTAARRVCQYVLDNQITDWHRSIVPWARNSSGASQAKTRLELEFPALEFRTFSKNGCRWMETRMKVAE